MAGYLARYSDGRDAIVQAAVRVQRAVFERPDRPNGWWANFDRLSRQLVGAPSMDLALRITVERGRVERLVILLAPESRTDEARALAAGFFVLNTLVQDSVTLPADRQEHDNAVVAFPPLRLRLRQDVHSYDGFQLITDFRLSAMLDDLLQAALTHGWSVAYQANVRRAEPLPDDLRWLRKNLLHAEEGRLPGALYSLQQEIVRKVERAAFLVDEYVGVDREGARDRLVELLASACARRCAATGLPAPVLDTDQDGAYADLISSGLHLSAMQAFTPPQKAAGAATADEVMSLGGWRPPDTWAALLENGVAVGDGAVDHLKRIEAKLADIERALEARNAPAQECGELRKAVQISRADPPFALAKARQIVEGIVQALYLDRHPGRPKPLFDMIEELAGDPVIPRKIKSYLQTLRVLGNLSVHVQPGEQTPASGADVELGLLMALQLVEWYLLEYPGAGRPQAR
jgi:hypothetical protein